MSNDTESRTRESLCWSAGPRIGDEGHPYCLRPNDGHTDHHSHPASGYNEQWTGDLLPRADLATRRNAWLPDEILNQTL